MNVAIFILQLATLGLEVYIMWVIKEFREYMGTSDKGIADYINKLTDGYEQRIKELKARANALYGEATTNLAKNIAELNSRVSGFQHGFDAINKRLTKLENLRDKPDIIVKDPVLVKDHHFIVGDDPVNAIQITCSTDTEIPSVMSPADCEEAPSESYLRWNGPQETDDGTGSDEN